MAPRTPEQYEEIRKERKAEILDAALHIFAEQGYHSASVSQIAKRAGVSKGLMYNYFEGKREVLVMLVREMAEVAMEMVNFVPGEKLTPQRFQEIIERSVDIPLEEPQRWKLYMSFAFQPDVSEILMKEILPEMLPYIESMSAYFEKKGYDNPVAMMRIFSAALDGVQMHCLLDPENFPAEKAKEFLVKQFV